MVSRVGLHRNQWHQYAWGSSSWFPGGTTVLKVQDSIRGIDGLISYSIDRALEYAMNVTITKGQGPIYPLPPKAERTLHETVKGAHDAANAARDRGTAVHLGIEAMIGRFPYTPSVDTLPYWYGWAAFLTHEQPEIIATEQMIINLTHGFGGTIDLIAKLHGKIVQIDVKTGEPKPEHALQLAGYAAGEWMGQPDDPEQVPLPEFDAHYVLALMPDAPYYELVPLVVDEAATEHFLYLAETYHRLKKWSKAA